jgi:hypothetical protein
VVWIIGALATPVVALSALYFKMKSRSLFLGIIIGIIILLLLGVIITVVLKLIDPGRPIL